MLAEDLVHIIKRVAFYDDEAAFQQLFYHYFDSLLNFSKSILKNHQLAEEAVEDVFIKVWEKRQALPTVQNLKYYLFRSVKNSALNYLVKYENKSTIDIGEVVLECATAISPEEQMISSEAVTVIQNAINQLPAQCKLIFLLVKEERFKYKEVATLLGISIKTVETQMSIALHRIMLAYSPSGKKISRR